MRTDVFGGRSNWQKISRPIALSDNFDNLFILGCLKILGPRSKFATKYDCTISKAKFKFEQLLKYDTKIAFSFKNNNKNSTKMLAIIKL